MSTETKPNVELTGLDGNAFMIMGRVQSAMKKHSREHEDYDHKEKWAEYEADATSGDYDHLLQATMRFCEVS